jgi:hypothetical protein
MEHAAMSSEGRIPLTVLSLIHRWADGRPKKGNGEVDLAVNR